MGRALCRNVIRGKRSIKGLRSPYPQNIAPKDCQGLNDRQRFLFLEQLFGGRSMRVDAMDVAFHSGDLGFQGFDAFKGFGVVEHEGGEDMKRL